MPTQRFQNSIPGNPSSSRYMTFYNMLFTAFPLGIKALFDRDSHYLKLQKISSGGANLIEYLNIRYLNPYFYKRGQANLTFNNLNFILWIVKGILHGFFIWLTATFSTQLGPISRDGYSGDFWFTSITMFTSIYIVGLYNSERHDHDRADGALLDCLPSHSFHSPLNVFLFWLAIHRR